tara:strand:+ start:238 stop:828 length:591 start_codon:yes stop_codon:yes gene_type:complete
MATYQSIRYNVDYQGNAGSLMPLLLFTSDGSDATADFTSKIDSTYDEYLFIFNNIHPETDNTIFGFNGSIDGGSNYNVTKTTTSVDVFHTEDDSTLGPRYNTSHDIAQGTGVQSLLRDIGNANDESASGYLYIFNPSSTTFVKHFISEGNSYQWQNISVHQFYAGYFNTTSAIDAIQFSMSSGEIQGGTIGMFGVI